MMSPQDKARMHELDGLLDALGGGSRLLTLLGAIFGFGAAFFMFGPTTEDTPLIFAVVGGALGTAFATSVAQRALVRRWRLELARLRSDRGLARARVVMRRK